MIPQSVGIGLRAIHYRDILLQRPSLAWLEVHSENYFGAGGKPLYFLEQLREHYPISLHGVGLSLGSADPLNQEHLHKLTKLVRRVNPCFVSDHLAWCSVNQRYMHDLLPLPFTADTLTHLVNRIKQVQDFLEQPILIENISSYLQFSISEMQETEFLVAVAKQANCGILLDINNIYVNACNFNFNPYLYLAAIPADLVKEIHLAGFTASTSSTLLIDTHNQPVAEEVWKLYQAAIQQFGCKPTLIEWDADLPPLMTLIAEAEKARVIMESQQVTLDYLDTADKPRYDASSGLSSGRTATCPRYPGNSQEQFLIDMAALKSLGFDVYHNNILSNHIRALRDIYPLIEKLVGKECFHTAAAQYTHQHPSQQSDLHEFGNQFNLFLAKYKPTQPLAYLPEVAKLEWACHSIFFAVDHPHLDIAAFNQVTSEQQDHLHLHLHPASQLLAFNYPVTRIAKLCHGEIDGNVHLDEPGDYLLVIRPQLEVQTLVLSMGEFTFLEAIKNDLPLLKAYETALQVDPQFPLETKLPQWVQEKTIVGFEVKTYSRAD